MRFSKVAKRFWARPRLAAAVMVVSSLFAVNLFQTVNSTQIQGGETTVALVKSASETPSDAEIDALVRQAVALAGGLPANVGPGKKVIIHPNLVQTLWTSGSGVVTHRQVVRTVVQMCIERGVEVSNIKIAEGTASFADSMCPSGRECPIQDPREATRKAFKDAGYDEIGGEPGNQWGDMIEDVTGVQLVDLNDVGRRYPDYPNCYSGPYDPNYVTQVNLANGLLRTTYWIPNPIMRADVVINVPVFKNHSIAGVTGALKLAGGTAPNDIYHTSGGTCDSGPYTNKTNCYHNPSDGGDQDYNARAIVDLNLCRPPDFVVVDALVGVTNGPVGPGSGTGLTILSPKMACIVAGRDPVAVDTILSLMMAYDPDQIPTITYALSRGLGVKDRKLIKVVGTRVKLVRRTFPDSYGAGRRHELTSPSTTGWNVTSGAYIFGTYGVTPTSPSDSGGGVCKGEVWIDGVWKAASSASPYRVNVDVGSLTPGQHTLQYILYDIYLNENVRSATINVAADPRPRGALGLADGVTVMMGELVVSGTAPVMGSNVFFAQTTDRSAGFRVVWSSGSPGVSPGDVLIMSGTMQTANGYRYISAATKTKVGSVVAPTPLVMRNVAVCGGSAYPGGPTAQGATGISNVGLLVRTTGKITEVGADYFYVDDGSVSDDGTGRRGLRVFCGDFTKPALGSYVSITGFSTMLETGGVFIRQLVARSAADIVTLAGP